MNRRKIKPKFAICIHNEEYPVSLEVRKIYQLIPDRSAARHKFVRIVDESGEDYLYPESYFIPIKVPSTVEKALLLAS